MIKKTTKRVKRAVEDPIFILGSSTEKPNTLVPLNSIFVEKDTGNRYQFLETNVWKYIDKLFTI